MTNPQAEAVKELPLTAKVLKRHPLPGEELLINVKAKVQGAPFAAEDDWKIGEFLLTGDRIGAITPGSDLAYYIAPIEDLRFIGCSDEENILYLRYVDPDKPEQTAEDIYVRVQFDAPVMAGDVCLDLVNRRTDSLLPDTLAALPEIGRDIYERRHDAALRKLDRLLTIEPMNDLLHLMKARTLRVSGRSIEAATYAAKHHAERMYFAPGFMMMEYIWYDWHNGAVRLLPDESMLQGEEREECAAINRAVQAKAAGDPVAFVRHACELLRISMRAEREFSAFWIFYAYMLLSKLKAETADMIGALYRELLVRAEQENRAEPNAELGKLIELSRTIFSVVDQTDGEALLAWFGKFIGLQEKEEGREIQLGCLYREQFEQVRSMGQATTAFVPPESWSIGNFITDSDMWTDGVSPQNLEERALQIWLDARLSGVDSPDQMNRLYQLTQGSWKEQLKELGKEHLLLLITLLQTERSIKRGQSDEALSQLAVWKKENHLEIGRLDDPWLRYAGELLDYYTAWGVRSETDMREALGRIPDRHPFCWLHREAASAIEALRAAKSDIGGHEEVLRDMQRAIAMADRIAGQTELAGDAAPAARSFSGLLRDKLAETDQVMAGKAEAAAARDNGGSAGGREAGGNNRGREVGGQGTGTGSGSGSGSADRTQEKPVGFFGRLKRLFGGAGADEEARESRGHAGAGGAGGAGAEKGIAKGATVDSEESRGLIRIAIAGESGSGKTTLLNAIFRTNLFFATQEEATGVPTEVRFGAVPRIEVKDRSGAVRRQLDIPHDWFETGRFLLLPEPLEQARTFMTEHTRVGSAALEWVERVIVTWPLEGLPPHAVLLDTPGFNANDARSAIAEAVLRTCNICLYIMDARNALKGQEMETLQAIREEAGKTFIILNKMDLVFGDDELDCDGAAAADETIARVRKELASKFGVDDVIVFPVCSLPKSELSPDAAVYAGNLETLVSSVFQEAEDRKLDYIIDASAKSALDVFREVRVSTRSAAAAGELELRRLERSVPHDFRLFEEEAEDLLQASMKEHRGAFFDAMNENLQQAFGDGADQFATWLQQVSSASQLKKEVQAKAESVVQTTISRLERERRRELEKMGERVAQDAADFMRGLYSSLPFPASYEAKNLIAGMSSMNVSSSGQLSAELSSINYGDGINGGAAVGVAIGALVLGPIGAIIGGFLGQLFGGKSLGDVKQEVYESFTNSMSGLWDRVADVLNRDLAPQQTASFLSKLQTAVDAQLDEYRKTVRREIDRQQSEWRRKLEGLTQLQLTAAELQTTMERLRDWRSVRRARLG